MTTNIKTLGIYGAGKSGIAIARLALTAGYRVRISTSGTTERVQLLLGALLPEAKAVAANELAESADAVVLAVPLRQFSALPRERLVERIVIDVMNYWPPVDGTLPAFDDGRPSSRVVQDLLPPSARLVKTLNHIGYHEMEELARHAGAPDRRALAVSGDDPEAVGAVARLVDSLGFDPVPAGRIDRSDSLQPGSPVFGADLTAAELRRVIAGNLLGNAWSPVRVDQ